MELAEVVGDGPVERDGVLSRAGLEFGDRLDPDLVDVRQLGEQGGQRRFGCLVVSDPFVGSGLFGEHSANRRTEDGIRDGACVEQQIGADDLGELEGRDEGDVGDAPHAARL